MQTTANSTFRNDAAGVVAKGLSLLSTTSPTLSGPIVGRLSLLVLVLILIGPGGSGIGA